MIKNYYEKISHSKQEKPFDEVILQVGNCKDVNAQSENGQLAAKVLDEYMQGFQSRNPNLRVFSAHLHMDEAAPHLHIDFVPFTSQLKADNQMEWVGRVNVIRESVTEIVMAKLIY